jgi:adenylylsulfate kinase-like enzyme
MIYWFIGQPSSGKTTLALKLHKFLKTEKRNWRRDVFHVDGDGLRELYKNKDYTEQGRRTNITNAQALISYLHENGCDVVVSIVAPYLDLREDFKEKYGADIVEVYLHTTEKRERDHYHVKDYEHPISNFIDIDTTKDSPNTSFSKIITNLHKLDKL